jgi:hypothetical protein
MVGWWDGGVMAETARGGVGLWPRPPGIRIPWLIVKVLQKGLEKRVESTLVDFRFEPWVLTLGSSGYRAHDPRGF